MATFTGHANTNDYFKGKTGEANIFNFRVADLNSGDTLIGADYVDTLNFTTAGTVTASALSGVSKIERIVFQSNGNASITLSDSFVINADYGLVEIFLGNGNDTVDASSLVGKYNSRSGIDRVFVTAGSGQDRLLGGAGDDMFTFALADLRSNDVVTGGAGMDTLVLTTAGTIPSSIFANVRGIEKLVLGTGTNDLTLSNAMVGSATGGVLSVIGSGGSDTIDARGLRDGNAVDITAGTGQDTFLGGSGDDIFRFKPAELGSNDVVNGGAGFDTIAFDTPGTIPASVFANVTGVEEILLGDEEHDLTISNAFVGRAGGTLRIVSGANVDTVDASAVQGDRSIDYVAGSGQEIVTGGKGNDVFEFEADKLEDLDEINGGPGTDTLDITTGGKNFDIYTFDSIRGIERITLAGAVNDLLLKDAMVASANGHRVAIVGSSGSTIDASALKAPEGIDFSGGQVTATGGAGADSFTRVSSGAGPSTITGGGGADLFAWDVRDGTRDTITDFSAADGDTLGFAASMFDYNGTAFDTKVTATSTATDITGADLVVYTGGALNSASDVATYLKAAAGGSVDEGLFIAGTDGSGHTVLYHALDASFTDSTSIAAIADLGTTTAATQLTTGMFRFS